MLATDGAFWLLGALVLGCAMSQRAPALRSQEHFVPARDPGILLYLRNKAPADLRTFSPEKTVLFVHGATYPSEIIFDLDPDLDAGEGSWMDYIARRGYDVYLLDIRGYGRSTRPEAMSQPPEAHAPFAHTEEAAADVAAAVDFILQHRGIRQLNLIGWSWGTTTTALFSTREPEKVAKLVMFAPVFTPARLPEPAPPVPQAAYRAVTLEQARQRWLSGVPASAQAALVPQAWFDTWARAALESDPEGSQQSPPVLRAPNGVMVDILGEWLQGRRLYDPALLRAPTLIIKGDWDVDTPSSMAQVLFASLSGVPFRSYIEIGEGTHMLALEKHRGQLFRAVQHFLDDTTL